MVPLQRKEQKDTWKEPKEECVTYLHQFPVIQQFIEQMYFECLLFAWQCIMQNTETGLAVNSQSCGFFHQFSECLLHARHCSCSCEDVTLVRKADNKHLGYSVENRMERCKGGQWKNSDPPEAHNEAVSRCVMSGSVGIMSWIQECELYLKTD